jgi:hypothetical protein
VIRLIVRTRPAHGDARRYRAGLGPFGREPLEVEATPAQAAAKPAPPPAAARTRRKNGAEAANG